MQLLVWSPPKELNVYREHHIRQLTFENPEFVTLHVTARLLDGDYISDGTVSLSPKSHNDVELMEVLKGAEGVCGDIMIHPFSVTVKRGLAFDRDDVLESLLLQLQIVLAVRGVQGTWEKGPTLRNDINHMQCPECKRVQQEEIARAWRDFDSLE